MASALPPCDPSNPLEFQLQRTRLFCAAHRARSAFIWQLKFQDVHWTSIRLAPQDRINKRFWPRILQRIGPHIQSFKSPRDLLVLSKSPFATNDTLHELLAEHLATERIKPLPGPYKLKKIGPLYSRGNADNSPRHRLGSIVANALNQQLELTGNWAVDTTARAPIAAPPEELGCLELPSIITHPLQDIHYVYYWGSGASVHWNKLHNVFPNLLGVIKVYRVRSAGDCRLRVDFRSYSDLEYRNVLNANRLALQLDGTLYLPITHSPTSSAQLVLREEPFDSLIELSDNGNCRTKSNELL